MKRTLLLFLSTVLIFLTPTVHAQSDSEPDLGVSTDQAEPEDEDRVKLNFSLGEGSDGGQGTLTAGDLEYQENLYVIATGGVDFKYRGIRLQAERLRVDIPTNLLTAEGEIVLDEGPQRLVGETIEYDLDTRTGRVTQATAYIENEYYFTGSQITKTGDTTYSVDDGIFTSCDQDVPSWSIHMSDASVTLDEFVRIKNARLKFKKLPVFYSPYLVWPANTERSSGLLVPKPGFSRRRGAELNMAYYKTLGRSADATFLFDISSKEYFGLGTEVRYRPSEGTEGYIRGYWLSEPSGIAGPNGEPTEFFDPVFSDRQPGDARWKLEILHESRDIWNGFRGVVSIQEYSDLDYLKDFERNANQQSQSFIYSNAYLSKNFGPHSFNIQVDQRERILGTGRKDVRRQLPEIEYRLRKLRLGSSQIYLDLESAVHYFSVDIDNSLTEEGQGAEEYGRVDIAPSLSIPLSSLSWLSAEVELGGRATFYTQSFTDPTETDPDTTFEGGDLTRTFPRAGLNVIGPSISRIFDKKIGPFSKLKHIVEPRLSYSFVGDFDEQDNIFRFDEIDNLRPANGLLFSVTNRLVAKPSDPDQGGAVEIASLVVSQGLSLDDTLPGQFSISEPEFQTDEGPLGIGLRINPSQATSVRLDAGFNTLFNSAELQSLRLSGSTKLGRHLFGLSWFSDWDIDFDPLPTVPSEQDPDIMVPVELPFEQRTFSSTKRSEQLRVSSKLSLLPNRLSLEAELSFDILGQPDLMGNRQPWDLLQQRYFLNWASQCHTWQLEYRESNFRDVEERDVRFSLTLKNVGTFLDLNDSF